MTKKDDNYKFEAVSLRDIAMRTLKVSEEIDSYDDVLEYAREHGINELLILERMLEDSIEGIKVYDPPKSTIDMLHSGHNLITRHLTKIGLFALLSDDIGLKASIADQIAGFEVKESSLIKVPAGTNPNLN